MPNGIHSRESNGRRVLVIRVEPTSYSEALLSELRAQWPGPLNVVYTGWNVSQDWGIRPAGGHTLQSGSSVGAFFSTFLSIFRAKPDLVFSAGWGTPAALAAIAACWLRRTPIIIDSDTWKSSPEKIKHTLRRILYPLLFRLVAHFTPAGQRQKEYLLSYGVPEEKITVGRMSVDIHGIRKFLTERHDARRTFRDLYGIPEDAVLVLFVGRLVEQKGVVDLLSVWREAHSTLPHAWLVITGAGPLTARVREASVSIPRIVPTGRLSGVDLWAAYASADILVVPSTFEPWGLVVNEGMAAGVAVLASDACGCATDLVFHERTGLLVKAASQNALIEALTSLVNDQHMRATLSANAFHLISDWTISNQARIQIDTWNRFFDSAE